jgi:hypothetical protein
VRDLDPRLAHLLRLARVAADEHALAADAAQDPQAGDGVGAERREPALRLALRGLALLERLDEQRD